jgi:hypothetical protein
MFCRDVRRGQELFLMDLALSQSLRDRHATLATRTIPLGAYWMTGGAALPINHDMLDDFAALLPAPSNPAVLASLRRMGSGAQEALTGLGGQALWIVRACLAASAADYVSYGAAPTKPKRPQPKHPWRRRK